MMFCPHCGTQLPGEVPYCPSCGKPTGARAQGSGTSTPKPDTSRAKETRPATPQQHVTVPQQHVMPQSAAKAPRGGGLSIRIVPAGISALVFLCAGLWLVFKGLASFGSLVKLLYYCDVSEEILSVAAYLASTALAGACAAFAAVETILAEKAAATPSFRRSALANAICAFALVALGSILANTPLETWIGTTFGDSMSSALSASLSLVTEDLGSALLSFGIALAVLLIARFAPLDARHVTRER